jgi:hypothetical protein
LQVLEERTQTTRSSRRLFLVLGVAWIVLGMVIVSQLPNTVRTFITINWATETETDTAGFNIYRAESTGESCEGIPPQAYVQINDELISSTGSAIVGDSYSYVDRSVERDRRYCYQLEDVELGGRLERHDPIPGKAPRQIDRILYIVLAPLSLVVGMSLIVSGMRMERKL